MNFNRYRPYTALMLLMASLLITITGVVLFFAPHGPGSRNWEWLALTRHELKDIHIYLGFFAVVLILFHGYLNLKPLSLYLNDKRHGLLYNPLLWSVGVILVIVWLALSFGS